MIGWACGTHMGEEGCIQVLVGKPEGKRSLRIPRHTWEVNIKMDFRKYNEGEGLD